METLTQIAQAISYPDLRRRLLKAYQAHSANLDPNLEGDPHMEAKLGAKLATYDEPAFIHLMHNIRADSYLHNAAQYDLCDYATYLRAEAILTQPRYAHESTG